MKEIHLDQLHLGLQLELASLGPVAHQTLFDQDSASQTLLPAL